MARNAVRTAVVNVDAVGRGGDAPVAVGGGRRECGDVRRRLRKRLTVVHLQQPIGIAARQFGVGAGGKHHAPPEIVLGHGTARVRAHLHHQHIADGEFGADAEQHCGNAGAVGVGKLGKVAGTHQDLGIRQSRTQRGVAQQRGREAEMDGVENRIEQTTDAAGSRQVRGAHQ